MAESEPSSPSASVTEAVVPNNCNSDFHELTDQLIHNAEAADSGDSVEDVPIPIPIPHLSSRSTQPPRLIALKLLFDYSTPSGTGLAFYWKGGLKNLDKELETYDLLYEAEQEEPSDADGSEGSNSQDTQCA
jgi:hypothetical protein